MKHLVLAIAITACASAPYEVRELTSQHLDIKGRTSDGEIGLNEKKEVVIRKEVSADTELRIQEMANAYLYDEAAADSTTSSTSVYSEIVFDTLLSLTTGPIVSATNLALTLIELQHQCDHEWHERSIKRLEKWCRKGEAFYCERAKYEQEKQKSPQPCETAANK